MAKTATRAACLFSVAMVVGAVLTSCGTTTRVSTGLPRSVAPGGGASVTGTTSAAPPTNTAAAGTSNLSDVGTVTETGPGTSFTEQVKIGPIGYGAPEANAASVAMNACQGNIAYDAQANAYAEGQVTFSYSQGRQPLDLSLDLSNASRAWRYVLVLIRLASMAT